MPVDQLRDFEKGLNEYVETSNPGVLKAIEEKKVLDDDLRAALTKVIKEFKDRFVSERQAVQQSAKQQQAAPKEQAPAKQQPPQAKEQQPAEKASV